MKLIVFYALAAVFILTSCGKEATVHIKAINAVTGEPYAGLAYGVHETKLSTNAEEQV